MKKYFIIAILFLGFLGNGINLLHAQEKEATEASDAKQLKLNSVKVIEKDELELEFDSIISNNSDNDISIRNISSDNEIYVTDYIINNKKLILKLENKLESNKDYEVIIFSVIGEDGSTITSGLDGAFQFNSGDLSIYDKQVVDLESAAVEPKIEEKEVEKEVKKEVEKEVEKEVKKEVEKEVINTKNENLAGKNIKQEIVDKNIENVAAKKEELAQTGPEHVLLTILALILSGLIFYTINQRKNNKI